MHLVMRPLCPHLQIRRVLERTCVTTSHPTHEAEGSLSMSRQRLMVPGTTFISLRDEETKSRPEASRPGAAPNTMRPIPVQKDSLNVTSRVLFELLGIFSRKKIQAHTKASLLSHLKCGSYSHALQSTLTFLKSLSSFDLQNSFVFPSDDGEATKRLSDLPSSFSKLEI